MAIGKVGNNCIVYRHKKKDDKTVFYIGIGTSEKRASTIRSRNNHWKAVVEKHGFIPDILAKELSWSDACELEILLIELYGRSDLNKGTLVNKTNGGDGVLGLIAWNIGKPHSYKTRQKLSLANIGKKHNIETKLKISNSNKGRSKIPMSKITKEKLSILYRKQVVDCLTGDVFISAKELAKIKNIEYTSLCKKLSGARKNKTQYKYL